MIQEKGKTMITREEVRNAYKKVSISHELMAYRYNYYLNCKDNDYQVCINPTWEIELNTIRDYITQKEMLTTTVKRYFELKAKGITTEAEALEHRDLLKRLYEMVGIEE